MLQVNRQALRYSNRSGLCLQGYSKKATEKKNKIKNFQKQQIHLPQYSDRK
jgi:hypothetical protein